MSGMAKFPITRAAPTENYTRRYSFTGSCRTAFHRPGVFPWQSHGGPPGGACCMLLPGSSQAQENPRVKSAIRTDPRCNTASGSRGQMPKCIKKTVRRDLYVDLPDVSN